MLLRPVLCVLSLALPLAAQTSNQAIQKASDLIRTDDLKGDIFFLASDDLAGRNTGSREDHIATDYIAAEFCASA